LLSDTVVRNYMEVDVEGIISLYNSNPMKGPSFIRNESFLRYFIGYPGVLEDGIFVAQKDGEIEAIAIVSISDKEDLREGKIIELRAKNASIIDLLLQKVLQYCRDKGADMVSVRPLTQEGTDEIFDGWIKVAPAIMMAKPLSILPILKPLLDTDLVRKYYAGRGLIFILDEEIIGVEVSSNGVQIGEVDRTLQDSAIEVTMSSKTALEIIFGWTNPYIAYLARKIKIRTRKNAPKVLRLLHSIRIEAPWHVALVDDM
jgi:hypothetical protein